MAGGFWIVKGDKTSCGGTVLNGRPEKKIGKKLLLTAVNGSPVSCGKHPGTYHVAGGYPGDIIHNAFAASTLYSRSTCPCKAFFIPSQTFMSHSRYEESEQQKDTSVVKAEPAPLAKATNKSFYPPYLTGEKNEVGLVPDYPVLRNTLSLPDENLRAMLSRNSHDVMLLTLLEAFEVLQSWGWKDTKDTWVETTQSDVGQVLINYGVSGKDVVTTSMIIAKLGGFGIMATTYINNKGTELIKLSGYPGIRKVLNAPVFAIKNPKVVDLGIGKYGVEKSIVEGARLTFYVAAAYRTIDFILNDETSLTYFLGSLATDAVKIGIVSAVSWGAGAFAVAYIPFISAPLVIVVGCGFLAAWGLNKLDEKYGLTNKMVAYIEAAQQEFVAKAIEIETGIWDLGAMYADNMLAEGVEVINGQIKKYIRSTINDIIPRGF